MLAQLIAFGTRGRVMVLAARRAESVSGHERKQRRSWNSVVESGAMARIRRSAIVMLKLAQWIAHGTTGAAGRPARSPARTYILETMCVNEASVFMQVMVANSARARSLRKRRVAQLRAQWTVSGILGDIGSHVLNLAVSGCPPAIAVLT